MAFNRMPPELALAIGPDKSCLAEFWNKIRVCDDPGETSWDVLEPIEREVTELLYRGTAEDLRLASRLTAKAKFFWHGGRLND